MLFIGFHIHWLSHVKLHGYISTMVTKVTGWWWNHHIFPPVETGSSAGPTQICHDLLRRSGFLGVFGKKHGKFRRKERKIQESMYDYIYVWFMRIMENRQQSWKIPMTCKIFPHLPRWGSLDFIRRLCFNCELQISVGTAGPQRRLGTPGPEHMAENARQSEYMSDGMRERQNGCQRECQIISYFRVFSALEVSSHFQAQFDVFLWINSPWQWFPQKIFVPKRW